MFYCGRVSGDKQNNEDELKNNEQDLKPTSYFETKISNIAKSHSDFYSLDVPNIDSSFKSWMDFRSITNKNSNQYKFIHMYGWTDSQGFLRASRDAELDMSDDYYLIALGSYYGTSIGTKYRITTDVGTVFYGILADCKDDIHTDSTNRYNPWNGNVVEFIVDSSILNPDVKISGTANVLPQFNGRIKSIEKIDF